MRGIAAISVVCLLISFALDGAAPFGRAMMAAGLPGWASVLFEDPSWRGAALYRAGRFDEAAEMFSEARATYNLGNSLVHAGQYAAALEAYDLAIMRGDDRAEANFDLVAAYYARLAIDADAYHLTRDPDKEGTETEGFVAQGNARAAGTGSEVTNANTMMGLAELDSRGRLGVRKVFDDAFIVADERWLAQLSDVPGTFLKARITHQHKRRVRDGLAPPAPEDPR
ncbi:MAG: tetratricopeptide repeat protein [Pseudomonadota bacterium]